MLSQANVEMMLEYLPLSQFKAIYVVDLCASLCKQARLRVQSKGWANVHVIEGDACTFAPPMQATAVTFSYSLSSASSWRHCLIPTLLHGAALACNLHTMQPDGGRQLACKACCGASGSGCVRQHHLHRSSALMTRRPSLQ